MEEEGYQLSSASRFTHSLDAFYYQYENTGGNKDMIKIELNYSLRAHILEPVHRKILSEAFDDGTTLRMVAPMEICIFDTCKTTKLTFYAYAMSVCIINNLLGQLDVVFKAVVRTIDHNGGKSAIDTGLTKLEAVTMVKVKSDRKVALKKSCLYKLNKEVVLCILSCACGNLKNQRGLELCSCLGDTLNDFHVVYVESTNSVAALVSLLKHFFG